MHKIILVFKNFVFRNFLTVLGLSSVCFIFEACYGVPKGNFNKTKLVFTGQVLSSDSSHAIDQIKVTITETGNGSKKLVTRTDSTGFYNIGADNIYHAYYKISADDTDGILNGEFKSQDTIFIVSDEDISRGYLPVNLKLKRK